MQGVALHVLSAYFRHLALSMGHVWNEAVPFGLLGPYSRHLTLSMGILWNAWGSHFVSNLFVSSANFKSAQIRVVPIVVNQNQVTCVATQQWNDTVSSFQQVFVSWLFDGAKRLHCTRLIHEWCASLRWIFRLWIFHFGLRFRFGSRIFVESSVSGNGLDICERCYPPISVRICGRSGTCIGRSCYSLPEAGCELVARCT